VPASHYWGLGVLMNRFRLAFGFMRSSGSESEDPSQAREKMTREIKGSIFTLLALFQLVSLTSYISLDSFSIFTGRLDHINNLGGIVGALVGEWFLGTVGINGYVIVLITLGLAFGAFKGVPVRHNFFKVLGATIAAILAAIACHLLWSDKFPEASLLQGGLVGKTLGDLLRRYFNTTGALLIVGGGFVVTFIMTTGASISRSVTQLFYAGDESDEPEFIPKIIKPEKKVEVSEPKKTVAKKRGSRKRKGATDEDGEENGDLKPLLDAGEEGTGANGAEEESGTPTPKEFRFTELIPFSGNYEEPSMRLLKAAPSARRMSRGEIKDVSKKLVEHLLSFQITGQIVNVSQGPVLTTFEYKPSAGIKLSKIANLQNDLGVVLGTNQLRIVAPIPGKTVVGIELPRPQIETIALKDVLSEKEFHDKKYKIPFTLGKTTDGKSVFADITAMPHLLVAGGTGSGKSVFINSLIMSFLFRLSPRELRLILVDPKMLELNAFDGIPHLVTNVITSNEVAFNALSWAVIEMDRRYGLMAQTGSKNIDSYNEKVKGQNKIPYIVIVVDELADLMLSGGEQVEIAITRLAQKARAAGIHLVLATQRPSTDVVTGLIKANMPSRLSFKVPSGIDSRTVLDAGGAEELIGRGDSLMIQPAIPMRRLHGCFVTEEELFRVVKAVKGGRDFSDFYIDFGGSKKG
jgi:DNA segregation ATPase FtsK/SpoIIIE, S-DNA-T family